MDLTKKLGVANDQIQIGYQKNTQNRHPLNKMNLTKELRKPVWKWWEHEEGFEKVRRKIKEKEARWIRHGPHEYMQAANSNLVAERTTLARPWYENCSALSKGVVASSAQLTSISDVARRVQWRHTALWRRRLSLSHQPPFGWVLVG